MVIDTAARFVECVTRVVAEPKVGAVTKAATTPAESASPPSCESARVWITVRAMTWQLLKLNGQLDQEEVPFEILIRRFETARRHAA
jgi:hypothetical protein